MNFIGLTTEQAKQQFIKFGPNQISHQDKNPALKLFLAQLKSPLIYILILAAAFSFVLHEIDDAIFIIIVVLINTFLGFFQEYRAENTLKTLKSTISKKIKVIRDGHKVLIDSDQLVPGDLLVLEPGVKVAGDGVLKESVELAIDESLLTGESLPVQKHVHNKVGELQSQHKIFKGSSVVEGVGVAEITATGDQTYFGQIAHQLTSEFDPQTPIKLELSKISKVITILIIAASALILLLGIYRGLEFKEIFLTSIALGVSTIPEGLIIALTITLALGMNRIMAQQAIVKNLPAAETLGDVDVLCIDKTGTLTYGNMQITKTEFVDESKAMRALVLCNNETNFIDHAIKKYILSKLEVDQFEAWQNHRQLLFPFASANKYTGSYDGQDLYAVGAPEKILNFCTKVDAKWQQTIELAAKEGYRLIALAYKQLNKSDVSRSDFAAMNFGGLLFVKDPIRESAADSLRVIRDAGVQIKVITGDLKETAVKVLHSLNFFVKGEEIISGEELKQIKNQEDFDKLVQTAKLFYRTTPDQKLSIVQSLQRQKKRVGMMGDGVNDSPALKSAEIGISVDSATDVSKEVSDVILLDSNFQTIVDAIDEGRNIFQNLRKIMTYLFAGSLSESILILLSLIFNLPLPLNPLHLLWINIIEDGLPSLALSFDRSSQNLLKNKPRNPNQSLFDKKVIFSLSAISLVIDLVYFVMFKWLIDNNYVLKEAQTIIFAGVSISSLLFIFSAKTVDSNIWLEKIFNNLIVNISVVIGFVLLFISIYWQPMQNVLGTVALNLQQIIILVVLAIINIGLIELLKYFLHKRFKQG